MTKGIILIGTRIHLTFSNRNEITAVGRSKLTVLSAAEHCILIGLVIQARKVTVDHVLSDPRPTPDTVGIKRTEG
ncbi:hypothetical protein T265_01076 [Opisthorchis viverrini]|uniref:Uncharacterized protein n=1 Tax=Opisthorchis viverrini TaxID=6198 RepID=A0A075AAZ4_OPIVI|nr:hypothetical protein T265_01076 [Opisthorchis viverrini]KER32990.1 hypothetical protein T265_01076 [Opisthorchis viverrini]